MGKRVNNNKNMSDKFPLTIIDHETISADQLRRWLALHHTQGLGPITFLAIAKQQIDPLQLIENTKTSAISALNLGQKTRHSLLHPDWQAIDADLNWAQQPGCHIIPIVSSWYPTLLREIADPPVLLYVQGDAELLQYPQIAMVGSRNPSHYGQEAAFDFAKHLSSSGLIITSGMASGIDSYSHRGALAATGLTIAVSGTGLDMVYPANNKSLVNDILKDGALVSEYPIGTKPLAHNFPRRNRIISGLSLGTLVVEAAVQSGSLITAKQATEQGREVLAIPGSIHSPMSRGCHRLIRQGAKLVETGDDILQELGPMISQASTRLQNRADKSVDKLPPEQNSRKPFSSKQQQLLDCIQFEPVSIDTLVERSRLTPESISSMLVELEISGVVTSANGFYCRS